MKNKNVIIQKELAEVFKAERPYLLRYACYRLGNEDDAKDVLQEVFLKLHTRISETDNLQINNLRSYLFRTLANACVKWQSNSNRLKTIPLDLKMDVAENSTEARNETDYQRIIRLLAEIPDEQAEVIRLRIYGDNSFAEIAFAFYFNKPIYLWHDIYELFRDELEAWGAVSLKGNLNNLEQ